MSNTILINDVSINGNTELNTASKLSETLQENTLNTLGVDASSRTIWVNGQPYGNAYVNITGNNVEAPLGAEIFNDFANNVASGQYSHAEGWETRATALASHAEGIGTLATNRGQHVEGQYNVETDGVHVVGCGTDDEHRLNAVNIKADGKVYIKDIGGFTGTKYTADGKDLATILSTVDTSDATSFNIENILNVTGATTLKGNVTLGDGTTDKITVKGTTNFKTDVDIDTNLNVDGNTTIGGTLDVTSSTTLSSDVTLGSTKEDNIIVNGDTNFTADVDIDKTLNVDGATTLKGNVTLGDVLTDVINMNGTVAGNIKSNVNDGGLIFNEQTNDDYKVYIQMGGNSIVKYTKNPTDATERVSFGTSENNTAIKGTVITLKGPTTINNTLNVAEGKSTTLGGDLDVFGTSFLSGAVTCDDNLNVSGTTTLGDLTVGGDLEVSGATRLEGSLTVEGTSTYLAGDTTIDADLEVNGTTTLGALIVNDDQLTTLGGDLVVNGDVTFNSGTPKTNEDGSTYEYKIISNIPFYTNKPVVVDGSPLFSRTYFISTNEAVLSGPNYFHGENYMYGSLIFDEDNVASNHNKWRLVHDNTSDDFRIQLTESINSTSNTWSNAVTLAHTLNTNTINIGLHGDTIVDGSLNVALGKTTSLGGAVTLGSAATDSIVVNGTTTLNAKLSVTSGGLGVTGNSQFSGNVAIGSTATNRTLTVYGNSTLDGKLVIKGEGDVGIELTVPTASNGNRPDGQRIYLFGSGADSEIQAKKISQDTDGAYIRFKSMQGHALTGGNVVISNSKDSTPNPNYIFNVVGTGKTSKIDGKFEIGETLNVTGATTLSSLTVSGNINSNVNDGGIIFDESNISYIAIKNYTNNDVHSIVKYDHRTTADAKVMFGTSDWTTAIKGSSITLKGETTVSSNLNVARETVTNIGGQLNVGGKSMFGKVIIENTLTAYETVTIGTTADNKNLTVNGNAFATAFYESSDATKKDVVSNLDVDFDKLKQIPKVNFTWKNDTEKKNNIGTIAQDLNKVYPELVNGEEGNMTVDYAKLSIIALAAIDKLEDRIKQLEDKLSAYEK